MNEYKLFLLDDHPAIQDALRSSITGDEQLKIIGQSTDTANVSQELTKTKPDILIADIQLKDTSLFTILPTLREAVPEIAVIIFSMHYNQEFVMKALEHNINGYVSKEADISFLIQGIKAALNGGFICDYNVLNIIREILSTLPSKIASTSDQNFNSLTEREQQIFRYLAEGHNTKSISSALNLSFGTVKNYQTSIYKKLGITTSTELVRYAMDIGIIKR
jgi:DNA-binding NarL/FixJ family response regulator